MDAKTKQWIDGASYEALLSKWRFAPVGDPMFQGETGKYYGEIMRKKRDGNPGMAVAASKHIGWEKP